MTVKRPPAIKTEHRARYDRISKADLVEAFRDLAREYLPETDYLETAWFIELERRVEIVRRERKHGNSMLYSDLSIDGSDGKAEKNA